MSLWVYIEFLLVIELGALGQHQVGDALIRVGLLRARLHDHATIEHGLARPETDATEILVAGAMGGGVIDLVLVVEMHTRVGGEQSGEFGLCAWRCELHAPVVTDQLATEIDIDQVETRSEEHTSELQSLMRISYAVFCLKKKNDKYQPQTKLQQVTD